MPEIGDLSLLRTNPILVLFLVLGLGVLVGRIKIAGIELGSVTGVLLVGLVAGYLKLPVPSATDNIGFIIFIYSVGVQAGPQFFSAFKADGARYLSLAVLTVISATSLAVFLGKTFDFELGATAGLLAGSLTSTPTLVAAQDAVSTGLQLPADLTETAVLNNISSAYAITYVFGMAGLILLVSVLPRLARIDIAAEAKERQSGESEFGARLVNPPTVKAYRVEKDELVGVRFDEEYDHSLPGEIQRIKRDGEVLTPEPDMALAKGDLVAIIGADSVHQQAQEMIGPEILDHDLLGRSLESRNIIVSHRKFRGKTLAQLDFVKHDQCWLTRVTRLDMDLPRRPDLKLEIGDRLLFTGARSNLDALADRLGYSDIQLQETDLVTFTFGIALGLLLGLPTLALGDTRVGLGVAGGVLLAGIFVGWFHTRHPNVGRLPYGARFVLMELGLLLFMAHIGVSAGDSIVSTFQQMGPSLALCGVAVTVVPVLICFGIGRYLMHMNGAILLGAITGAMTSTAALKQIANQAKSSVPLLGYAGTYAFGSVLLTLAGALAMRL